MGFGPTTLGTRQGEMFCSQMLQCRLRFLRRNGKFRGWSSQRSLHSAPIFRLLKVAVNGTHQCDSHNFWGALSSNKQSVTKDELLQAELGGSAASNSIRMHFVCCYVSFYVFFHSKKRNTSTISMLMLSILKENTMVQNKACCTILWCKTKLVVRFL